MAYKFHDLPKRTVIFTHIDPDTHEQTMVWVSGLMNDIAFKNIPVTSIAVDLDFASKWLPKRGLEPHRLDALRKVPTARLAPVIMLHWPDGTHLLADGSHRYFVAACRGVEGIRAKLVPHEIWEPYKVIDFPESDGDTLQRSFSGIGKRRK